VIGVIGKRGEREEQKLYLGEGRGLFWGGEKWPPKNKIQ